MNCNNCNSEKKREKSNEMMSVPYPAHELQIKLYERYVVRLWIALIVAISMLFLSNLIWLAYTSQYDTYDYSYEQDGNGNNIIGDSNEVDFNGSETENPNS